MITKHGVVKITDVTIVVEDFRIVANEIPRQPNSSELEVIDWAIARLWEERENILLRQDAHTGNGAIGGG